MNAVGFGMMGIMPMLVLLGLGAGTGLPLGLPPGPECPLMAKVAPDECLFYTTWAGVATPDPASENQAEQLLAEPEVQHLIAEIERRIKSSLIEAVKKNEPDAVPLVEDAAGWVKTVLTHPTVLFVSSVKVVDEVPDVRAGAVVRVGDDAAKLKATLEKHQAAFLKGAAAAQPVQIEGDTWYRLKLGPKAPEITWGVRGKYFIIGVGEGEVQAILARGQTPAPEWLTNLRKQLPVDRTATVSYVNVKTILETFVPMAKEPQLEAFLNASGLADVTSLSSVTGLDKEGFVSKTLVGISGEPRGLLSFAGAQPLTPDDLAPIPSDATIALAARVNANAVFETILSLVGKVEPRARGEIIEGIAEMENALGFELRNDVLKALGDSWCIYNSPGEGGLVITGLTAVVQVKDRQSLARVQENFAKAQMKQEEERRGDSPGEGDLPLRFRRRRLSPRIERFQFAGQEICFLNVRQPEFPLAPAWCLTEKELIVAPFPQNIKAYLSRRADFKSLAAVPEVAGLFEGASGPVALTYCDTRELFKLFYPFVPMLAQSALSGLQQEGIDIDVSILPSAAAIAGHLRPSVASVRRSEAGIELVGRQSLPGGSLGGTAGFASALMIPAVIQAREAARRTQSMNNLHQIGMAMQMHQADHGAFPAAYTTDKDGKPLLSWRVQILPYIGNKVLYERFDQDEPWDSEHNKKLIPLMPKIYEAPGSNKSGPGITHYLTIRGKDTVFPGKDQIKPAHITDGSSNTIMAVEAGDSKAVPWTKPDDFQYDEKNPIAGLVGLRRGGFQVLFCDGSVRFISEGLDTELLRRLFIRNDGETVDPWDLRAPGRDRKRPKPRYDDTPKATKAIEPRPVPETRPVPPRMEKREVLPKPEKRKGLGNLLDPVR